MTNVPPKILIVDDDADYTASARALLENQGYAVKNATDGKSGIAMAAAEDPDLIILDVMMEDDWAGYGVNQAIKHGDFAGKRRPPILMVSSVPVDPASRFQGAAEAEMVTPDAYLTKPLDVPVFLAKVRSLLGKSA